LVKSQSQCSYKQFLLKKAFLLEFSFLTLSGKPLQKIETFCELFVKRHQNWILIIRILRFQIAWSNMESGSKRSPYMSCVVKKLMEV